MGGGDLNMKKSWHPQTFQNIERVWKAEQKALAEKRKIEQLRKELAQEQSREEIESAAVEAGLAKRSTKLEWMYQGTRSKDDDKEEYLLGKPVDKRILGDKAAQEDDLQLGSAAGAALRKPEAEEVDAGERLRDMQAKVREDPMFMIKKRQQERLRELRNNPVRMRELRRALEKDAEKRDKKHHKKSKKKKKHHKKEKKHHKKKEKKERELREHNHGGGHSSESESDGGSGKQEKGPELGRGVGSGDMAGGDRRMGRSGSRARDDDHERHQRRGTTHGDGGRGSRDMDDEGRGRAHRGHRLRSRSRSPVGYGGCRGGVNADAVDHGDGGGHRGSRWGREDEVSRHQDQGHRRHRRPRRRRWDHPTPAEQEQQQQEQQSGDRNGGHGGGAGEDDEEAERQRRLKAMVANAKWREEERRQNLRKYEEEERREAEQEAARARRRHAVAAEEEEDEAHGGGEASFLRDVQAEAWKSSSSEGLAERVRRNVHYIQRTEHALQQGLKRS